MLIFADVSSAIQFVTNSYNHVLGSLHSWEYLKCHSSIVLDTQTPTPVSDNPSSVLNGTNPVAVTTVTPLEHTMTLSSELPQLTQTPLFSIQMLLLGSASLPSATSSSNDVPPADVPQPR